MLDFEQHPTNMELSAFALGQFSSYSRLDIEKHLAVCPDCQRRVMEVPADRLIELLRAKPLSISSGPAEEFGPRSSDVLRFSEECVTTAFQRTQPEQGGDDPLELLRSHERYRLIRLVANDGFASVYMAEHKVMHRAVAVKVIHSTSACNLDTMQRFRDETAAAARLNHPNIVQAFDAESTGENYFLVMEYVEGQTLSQLLIQEGVMPIEQACEYIRQAALGLHHAHKMGMVHRDIKPDNLIVTPEGCVKILDFGLASLSMGTRPGGFTEPNVVMGTPDYLAPEQAEDSSHADARSDIYSLGCTLFHLLTGTPPFPGDTPAKKIHAHRQLPVPSVRKLRKEITKSLDEVVARMMAKKPENRFQNAAEVGEILAGLIKQQRVKNQPKKWVLVATLVAMFGLVPSGIAIHRIQTDTGELVIETHGEEVEIVVKQNGKIVRLIDTKTTKSVTIHSGSYQLETKGAKGLSLDIDLVTLKRGEVSLASISRKSKVIRLEDTHDEVQRFVGSADGVIAFAVSPDRKRIVSGCWGNQTDHILRVWDFQTGKETLQLKGHKHAVVCLAWAPEGKHILSGSLDHSVRLWNAGTGELVRTLPDADPLGVLSVLFTRDSKRAVTCGNSTAINIWDLTTGKKLKSIQVHTGVVRHLASMGDGKRIVSASYDGTIRIVDIEAGKEVVKLKNTHSPHAYFVAVSPDDKRLVSGGADHVVKLWDIASGKMIREFQGHTAAVHGVAYSHDGKRLLSAGLDNTVRLWDLSTGMEIVNIETNGTATCVAFTPDDRHAVYSSYDCTIRVRRLPR